LFFAPAGFVIRRNRTLFYDAVDCKSTASLIVLRRPVNHAEKAEGDLDKKDFGKKKEDETQRGRIRKRRQMNEREAVGTLPTTSLPQG